MPLADFTVRVDDETVSQPREVRVVVYEHVSSLRAAATRYDNRSSSRRVRNASRNAETCGICHRFTIERAGEVKPLCAIVRLAKPHIGAGIVSHELAHAAVWIRELDCDDEPLKCENDEPFAWVLGELVRQTVDRMYELGVYEGE